jgi:hypothetical protein
MGIVTGPEGGTYIDIGNNISDIVRALDLNVDLTVFPSEGSAENVESVRWLNATMPGWRQYDCVTAWRVTPSPPSRSPRVPGRQ